MSSLASIVGKFLGAVLAECAPVIVEILSNAIHKGTSDIAENGAYRDDLRTRLLERLHNENSTRSSGPAGETPRND